MRKASVFGFILSMFLFVGGEAFAGGGQAGMSPGTGVKVRFAKGGADVWIPIQFRAEGHLGSEGQHGVGGTFSYDIGTGGSIFTGNFGMVAITPHYHYYFNPKESGPYVGGYVDLRFRSGVNDIVIGGKGGYKHQFTENWGIWAEGGFGFSTWGNNGFSRSNGGQLAINAGAHYQF